MKPLLFLLAAFCPFTLFAQQSNDLLVYSVKGKVSVIRDADKNKAVPVKIGSVLHVGDLISADKSASVTMLCNQGKPILLNKEGTFALKTWKDSCREDKSSLSSSYFRFIWGQMYSYSPENKEAHRPKSDMAVVRGEEPLESGPVVKTPPSLQFSKGMDTVDYFNKLDNFPLSWRGNNYSDKYIFKLYNAKGTKLLFRDTLRTSYILISRFRDRMQPGQQYRWTVSMKKGGPSKKRVLRYHASSADIDQFIAGLTLPAGITEDSATSSFRVAYLLEAKHFLEPALLWYEQANAADPSNELFRDQLTRYRNEFWIR
ncbi:MAG: hypothetical protein U0U70_10435 [Chitinophagaceae bacterium]